MKGKMKQLRHTFIAAAVLLQALSCVKEQDTVDDAVSLNEGEAPVVLSVSVGTPHEETKSFTETTTVDPLYVLLSSHNGNNDYNGTVPRGADGKYTVPGVLWNGSYTEAAQKKAWAASVPITVNAASVYADIDNENDVVASVFENDNEYRYKTDLTLTLEHLLCRIGKVKFTPATGYTISGLKVYIDNPTTSARIELGSRNASATTAGDRVLLQETMGSETYVNYLFCPSSLLTGVLTSRNQFTIEYTATKAGYSQRISKQTAYITFQSGVITNITGVLGGDTMDLQLTASVEPWEAEETSVQVLDTDSLTPLTMTATSSGNILWQSSGSTRTIQYSKNGGVWTDLASTYSGAAVAVTTGDVVRFRGELENTGGSTAATSNAHFSMTANVQVHGNIGSILKDEGKKLVGNNTLCGLFYNCTRLYNNPSKKMYLLAAKLTERCYGSMFYGCSNITDPPVLSGTELANYCYVQMFYNCSKLATPPPLPAMTLATCCYSQMFYGCTALKTAPELPATELATSCYNEMFYNCYNLTATPVLPATTLAQGCYRGMFQLCSNLVIAHELPATTLAANCYYSMFANCSKLASPPALPATTLASNCYYEMFSYCSQLSSAPALPATTLANYCYYGMFYNCTGLRSAPSELPATTLQSYCYQRMFYGCTSLTRAPELPATTLVYGCYNEMFRGCTNLRYVKALFTTTPGSSYTNYWLYNVNSTGTFIKSASATWNVTGESGVPSTWTIETE